MALNMYGSLSRDNFETRLFCGSSAHATISSVAWMTRIVFVGFVNGRQLKSRFSLAPVTIHGQRQTINGHVDVAIDDRMSTHGQAGAATLDYVDRGKNFGARVTYHAP
jgi:hypothetical protein